MPDFARSRLAAMLQEAVSKRREEVGLYREIAENLPLPQSGRVLDIGTGSGLQLKVLREFAPVLDLYGLDISAAAIAVAQKHLEAMEVNLRVGSIAETTYPENFFDLVICNASMSYWQEPVACFNEIYRILTPAGSAILIEPQRDIDMDEAAEIINRNLADKSRLRRSLAIALNTFGLRWGHKLGLKLYTVVEVEEMIRQSLFGSHCTIERITLQNLPFFMKVNMRKTFEPA